MKESSKQNVFSVSDEKKTMEFYDSLVDGEVKRGFFGKDTRFNTEKLLSKNSIKVFYTDVIKQHITKEDVVLDLGAGTGVFSCVTAPHCKKVVALEITPRFAEEAQKTVEVLGINNVEVQTIKVNDIPYADNSFDVLLMVDVIHHCSDPRETLVEAFRVLKPEGKVIIFEPNKLNPLLYLMCVLDKNEWGLLKLGSKGKYRKLLAEFCDIKEMEYNGLLIGPDSKLFIWIANFITLGPGKFLNWLAPKIFIKAIKK